MSAADWKAFAASDAMMAFKVDAETKAAEADAHGGRITTRGRTPKHGWPFAALAATCRKLLDAYLALPSNTLRANPSHPSHPLVSSFCLPPL